jgi:hypothetical protein
MSRTVANGRLISLSAVTCFALACMPIAKAQAAVSTTELAVSDTPSQALIYTFAAVTSPPSVPQTLSDTSCPDGVDRPLVGNSNPVDPRLFDAITAELDRKFSKKMQVAITPVNDTIAPGTLVIAGCLTTLDAGNAAARLVGFRLGSSHLSAHVRIMLQTRTELTPLQEFDVSVRGGNTLPPLGPAGLVFHAVKETKQTLNADGKRLADQIAKQFAQNQKNSL